MNGTLIYLIAVFCLAVMDVSAKWLTNEYSVAQVMFFRGIFAFLPILFLFKFEDKELSEFSLRTGALGTQVLRGLAVAGTVGTFVAALKFMPLADVVGVSLMGPVLMVVFALVILGERFKPMVVAYIFLGMVGVLMIVRPSGEISLIGGGLAFLSACLYAFAAVLTRMLGKTDTTLVTSVYTNVTLTLISGIWFLQVDWVTFSVTDLAICLLMGIAGGASNILFVIAFRLSEVSLVAVLDYTIYLWAALFGLVFFWETPTLLAFFGAGLIMASGFLVAATQKSSTPEQYES